MTRHQRIALRLGFVSAAAFTLSALTWAGGGGGGTPQARTYTTDADFDEGQPFNVNHTVVHDQLQLNTLDHPAPLPLVNMANSGRGTMVRIDAVTGQILGEYRTAPSGMATNPSRTAVDFFGNVWVGNRDEQSPIPGGNPLVGFGSVIKIGVCLGGTRVNADGSPNPTGQYLKGPFTYNTCVDRNHDGLIKTSRGLNDILAWPNVTDGLGGADGLVQDADDEAILVFQRTHGVQVRFVAIDKNNDVWVGGYPSRPDMFDKLAGATGAILQTFTTPACGGGHGGVVTGDNIIWSSSESDDTVLRYDLSTSSSLCIPATGNHGLGIDPAGNVWVNLFSLNQIVKIDPNGIVFPGFPKPSGGAAGDRAVCVTPIDSHVWCDSSGGSDVTRLDNDGNILKVINLGADGVSPRGVAVDSNGKVWVACNISNTAKRIDPHGGADGLGAVDLTVPLGRNASPYNYSDMTGITPLVNVQSSGHWSVVYDSGFANTEYGKISWNASVPAATEFTVEYRASDDPAALSSLTFAPALNGVAFSGVFGRFVEIRARFRRDSQTTATPALFDLTIAPLMGAPPEPSCVSGNRNPASLLVFPEFDNRFGDMTMLTVTNTQTSGNTIKVEFVYIGRVAPNGQLLDCLEFNRTETMTPQDTLSVITHAHNPNQAQGYVYAFAKDRLSGAAIVHNHLIGHAMIINGINTLTYSYNPVGFQGIGIEGTATDHDNDGVRDLNGLEYNCAPDELLVPRFIGQGTGFSSDLVLLNLTGGTGFDALVDFLIYNDNEEEFSAQTSFRCWVKRPLLQVSGVFGDAFLATTNNALLEPLGLGHPEMGWFRMDGNVASSPATSIQDPAILALLVESSASPGFDFGIGQGPTPGPALQVADLPFELGAQSNGDLLLQGIFGDSTP